MSPEPSSPAPPDAPSRPAVLVAEGDRDLRLVLAALLDRAGFQVLPAGDAREAVSRTLSTPPACLVLSAPLPGGEAAEVLRNIRELTEGRAVPAVVIAPDAPEFDDPALLSEGDRRLPPSFDPADLVAAVKAAVALRAAGR